VLRPRRQQPHKRKQAAHELLEMAGIRSFWPQVKDL